MVYYILGAGICFSSFGISKYCFNFCFSENIFFTENNLFLILALLIGVFQLPIKMMEYAGKLLSTIINNPIVDKMLVYSDTEDAAMTYSTGSLLLSTTLAVIKRSILLSFYIYVLKKSKVDPMTCFFIIFMSLGLLVIYVLLDLFSNLDNLFCAD